MGVCYESDLLYGPNRWLSVHERLVISGVVKCFSCEGESEKEVCTCSEGACKRCDGCDDYDYSQDQYDEMLKKLDKLGISSRLVGNDNDEDVRFGFVIGRECKTVSGTAHFLSGSKLEEIDDLFKILKNDKIEMCLFAGLFRF
jgi:hypothetical protein